jgi:hypothetical protein
MTADQKLGRAWLDRIRSRLLFDFSDYGFSASERMNWDARETVVRLMGEVGR